MKKENKNLTSKKIGERLREFRQSRQMKQEDMAHVLGISVPAYSKIETGINWISSKHLLTLKREFNISIEWLLCGEIKNETFGDNEEDVKEMLADMKASKRVLFSILSYYYGIIDAFTGTNEKKKKGLKIEGGS